MEYPEFKNLTPEQKQEITKAIKKGQRDSLPAYLWFGVRLFAANFVCLTLGGLWLKDVDPQMQLGFQMVCVITNALFATSFLKHRLKEIDDIVTSRIKDILNK